MGQFISLDVRQAFAGKRKRLPNQNDPARTTCLQWDASSVPFEPHLGLASGIVPIVAADTTLTAPPHWDISRVGYPHPARDTSDRKVSFAPDHHSSRAYGLVQSQRDP